VNNLIKALYLLFPFMFICKIPQARGNSYSAGTILSSVTAKFHTTKNTVYKSFTRVYTKINANSNQSEEKCLRDEKILLKLLNY